MTERIIDMVKWSYRKKLFVIAFSLFAVAVPTLGLTFLGLMLRQPLVVLAGLGLFFVINAVRMKRVYKWFDETDCGDDLP